MWTKHLDYQTGLWMVYDNNGDYVGSYDLVTANTIIEESNGEKDIRE